MKDIVSKLKSKKYISTIICYVIAVIICAFYEGLGEQESLKDVIRVLSDMFLIPAMFFAGFGALSYASSEGTYDMLGYIVSNFSLHHIIPGMRPKEKYESFYEYKEAKKQKDKVWLSHVFFVGLAGLVISLILVLVYSVM